ncbi:hypothetical protein [Aquimarina sp. 2201CG14-23]|uniref:hypothetical protein n=1 Tax=Aquimarina mycalae TaxID=3040073 RepID=UPI0024780C9D|nr:hypothetical protein [Aquimarina sp. 2201CG14-23]MDH7446814.1 hypothetical protein [Aquimarina sp. 2201CG14-23]
MKKKGNIKFILDRINGLIIFPKNIHNLSTKEYNIYNIRIDKDNKEVYYLKEDNQHHLVYHFLKRIITKDSFLNDWNFIFSYMDKNRPLPSGDAFDEYRQQDYERRKAEGFPKPLYPSSIKTPEATKEQQKERLEIGGW